MAEINADLYDRLETFVCASEANWAAFQSMRCPHAQLFVDLAITMGAHNSAEDIADSHRRDCGSQCTVAVPE
ncbi:hypothetical protein OG225_41775 (plasmid) [Nocardia sp. NBC_01377]|uniref:hypothetical protein n=1 Tax=Nocardia sp. NBC_01377 TaxID=2903595 RepID=UPI002F90DD37